MARAGKSKLPRELQTATLRDRARVGQGQQVERVVLMVMMGARERAVALQILRVGAVDHLGLVKSPKRAGLVARVVVARLHLLAGLL